MSLNARETRNKREAARRAKDEQPALEPPFPWAKLKFDPIAFGVGRKVDTKGAVSE